MEMDFGYVEYIVYVAYIVFNVDGDGIDQHCLFLVLKSGYKSKLES